MKSSFRRDFYKKGVLDSMGKGGPKERERVLHHPVSLPGLFFTVLAIIRPIEKPQKIVH
jgi:hypothetical protein